MPDFDPSQPYEAFIPALANMATGTTGSFDPETGERRTSTFQYRPTPMPQPAPTDFNVRALASAYQNLPIDDAERAVAAAMRFQGLRGYQEDLSNGVPADQAMLKWGPLLFRGKESAIAPMVRASTQPKLNVAPIPGGGHAVTYGPRMNIVRPTPPMIRQANEGIYRINPDGTTTTLIEPPQKPSTPSVADRSEIRMLEKDIANLEKTRPALIPPYKTFGISRPGNQAQVDAINKQVEEKKAEIRKLGGGGTRATGVTTVQPEIATAAGQAAVRPAGPPKAGDVYKGYRFKGGDPSKKDNWEKAE